MYNLTTLYSSKFSFYFIKTRLTPIWRERGGEVWGEEYRSSLPPNFHFVCTLRFAFVAIGELRRGVPPFCLRLLLGLNSSTHNTRRLVPVYLPR